MKKKRLLRGIIIGLLVVLVIGCSIAFWVWGEVEGRWRTAGEVELEIPSGATTTAIANILKESGAIGNPLIFRLYVKYSEESGHFQYGSFRLQPNVHYAEIIRQLQTVVQFRDEVSFTIPEGYNGFQIGEVLEQTGLCTKQEFLDAVNTHEYDVSFFNQIHKDPLKLVQLDGFLFPDTYSFHSDATVDDIVLAMLKNFEKRVLTEDIMAHLKDSGFTLEELVIFASIIQREAANVEEMYNVSSVFNNRMKPGSPFPQLESCTTNDYITNYINPQFDNKPPEDVIEAFDTYGMVGFPVGAIANPGLDAILAALSPNETPYYFFVTDITKKHYYGKTYEEHLRNIEVAKAVNLQHGKVGL